MKYRIKTIQEMERDPGIFVEQYGEDYCVTSRKTGECSFIHEEERQVFGKVIEFHPDTHCLYVNNVHIFEWMCAPLENTGEQRIPELPPKDDAINPKHYKSDPSGIECIQVTRHRNFNVGNAIKYLWRQGLKDGEPSVRDLRKAIWYIEDEIKRIEGENK